MAITNAAALVLIYLAFLCAPSPLTIHLLLLAANRIYELLSSLEILHWVWELLCSVWAWKVCILQCVILAYWIVHCVSEESSQPSVDIPRNHTTDFSLLYESYNLPLLAIGPNN